MLLAWSLTETVRYAFYALTLLNLTPRALTWLRYSTFIALYPLGAGAEAWGAWLSLPTLSSLPAPLGPAVVRVQKALGGSPGVGARLAGLLSRAGASSGWSAFDLVRAGLVFLVWPPGASSLLSSLGWAFIGKHDWLTPFLPHHLSRPSLTLLLFLSTSRLPPLQTSPPLLPPFPPLPSFPSPRSKYPAIYPPAKKKALYVMYTYMHVQRRKALGSGSNGRPTVVGSGKKRV